MYAPPARKLRAKLCPWLVYFFLTGCLDLFFPVLSAIFMWVFFFSTLVNGLGHYCTYAFIKSF